MRFAKMLAGAALAAACVGAPAGAATITQTATFALSGGQNFTAYPGPYTPAFTFAGFDTALGQLTGYTISLTSTYWQTDEYHVTPPANFVPAPFAGSALVAGSRGVEVKRTASILSATLVDQIAAAASWSGNSGNLGAFWSFTATGSGAGSCADAGCGVGASYFAGPGDLTIRILGAPNATLSGTLPNSIGAGPYVTDREDVSLTLTYDYIAAAVPEPAAWAMLLIGFGVVGATARAARSRPSFGSPSLSR